MHTRQKNGCPRNIDAHHLGQVYKSTSILFWQYHRHLHARLAEHIGRHGDPKHAWRKAALLATFLLTRLLSIAYKIPLIKALAMRPTRSIEKALPETQKERTHSFEQFSIVAWASTYRSRMPAPSPRGMSPKKIVSKSLNKHNKIVPLYVSEPSKLYHKLRTCFSLRDALQVRRVASRPQGYRACPLCALEYHMNPAIVPIRGRRK